MIANALLQAPAQAVSAPAAQTAVAQPGGSNALMAGAPTGGTGPVPASLAPTVAPTQALVSRPTPPSPEEIEHAHAHSDIIQSALHQLTGQKGKLTPKSVATAAAAMLSNPDLPPGSGEELAKQAASLIAAIPPDASDAQIRLMLGRLMLHTAGFRDSLQARFPRKALAP